MPRLEPADAVQGLGVPMDPGKVVSDVVFGSGGGARYTPTVLSLNRTAFSRDDIVTGQIETLLYAFGGAFELKLPENLKATELVEARRLDAGGQHERHQVGRRSDAQLQALRQPMPLACGSPASSRPPSRRAEGGRKKPAAADAGAARVAENSVIVVADVDLLADGAAVDVQEVSAARSWCRRTATSPSRSAWSSSSPPATT